jgi:lipopolysaccharide transport system permease protein
MLRKFVPFVADLWRYRSLLWQFTLRNVEMRHKGSHLGLIWSVLNPLLMLGLYATVFGYVMGGKFGILPNETRLDYGIGMFLGLAIFQFVAEVMGVAPILIVANPNFVKKVVFPLEILPAANVGSAFVHMVISLGLVFIGLFLFGHASPLGLIWLPIILLPVILGMLGASWFLAALGVFYRDIGQVMQFTIQIIMFSSGVFNSAHSYKAAWVILRFNPLLLAIEQSRNAALWGLPVNLRHIGYIYVVGLAACFIGHLAFMRMKPAFPDVL